MKLSKRDTYIAYVLVIGLLGYGLYYFVFEPMWTTNVEYSVKRDELLGKKKDLNSLIRLDAQKKEELQGVMGVFEAMSNDSLFSGVSSEDILTYMGSRSELYGIAITDFSKHDDVSTDGFDKVVFEMRLHGSYAKLTRMMNDLYDMDKYVYISDIELKDKDILPIQLALGSTESVDVPFDWASGMVTRLERPLNRDSIIGDYTDAELKKMIKTTPELYVKFYFVKLKKI